MSTFYVLLSVVLMWQACRACDGNNEEEQLAAARQQSDEYFANAYGYNPSPWGSAYYQPSARVPGYANSYEGRTALSRQPNYNPFKKYFTNNADEENNQVEGRFALGGLGANLINTGLFNNRFTPANTWRPFANLANRVPISVNPDFSGPLANFDACTSPSGDAGICAPGSVCSLFGGRPSGSCILGKVCCINAITTCGGTVTLNNTYWQSPSTAVSAPSTCALTVRLDTKLVEQLAKPICQIRLDFVTFTIAAPAAATSVCTDTFMVGGSTTVAPVICGENTGQHMYLDVPSSGITPSDVQLMFNFAAGAATRSWNIKIALLPCGASYLAPSECLQYFSASSGRVKSFNWQDAATARQLNNQNYNICFRTELVSGSRATQMCVTTCTTTTANVGFFLTGTSVANAAVAPGLGTVATTGCTYDFLAIPGGQNQATNFAFNDRYCGGALGAAGGSTICTKIRPFRMTYGTNADEAEVVVPGTGSTLAIPVAAALDTANTGFCLDYQEK